MVLDVQTAGSPPWGRSWGRQQFSPSVHICTFRAGKPYPWTGSLMCGTEWVSNINAFKQGQNLPSSNRSSVYLTIQMEFKRQFPDSFLLLKPVVPLFLKRELSFITNELQNVFLCSRTEKWFSDTIGICVLSAGGGYVAEKWCCLWCQPYDN